MNRLYPLIHNMNRLYPLMHNIRKYTINTNTNVSNINIKSIDHKVIKIQSDNIKLIIYTGGIYYNLGNSEKFDKLNDTDIIIKPIDLYINCIRGIIMIIISIYVYIVLSK